VVLTKDTVVLIKDTVVLIKDTVILIKDTVVLIKDTGTDQGHCDTDQGHCDTDQGLCDIGWEAVQDMARVFATLPCAHKYHMERGRKNHCWYYDGKIVCYIDKGWEVDQDIAHISHLPCVVSPTI